MMGFVLDWGGQNSIEQWFECITSAPGVLRVGLETDNPFLFKTTIPKKMSNVDGAPYQKTLKVFLALILCIKCDQSSLILEQMCLPFLLVKESI